MHQEVRTGFGIAVGRVLFHLASLALGLVCVSVTGLAVSGHAGQALFIVVVAALPYLALRRVVGVR